MDVYLGEGVLFLVLRFDSDHGVGDSHGAVTVKPHNCSTTASDDFDFLC